jgi:hypothetical protein
LPPRRRPAAAPCWGPRRSTSSWISGFTGETAQGRTPRRHARLLLSSPPRTNPRARRLVTDHQAMPPSLTSGT